MIKIYIILNLSVIFIEYFFDYLNINIINYKQFIKFLFKNESLKITKLHFYILIKHDHLKDGIRNRKR